MTVSGCGTRDVVMHVCVSCGVCVCVCPHLSTDRLNTCSLPPSPTTHSSTPLSPSKARIRKGLRAAVMGGSPETLRSRWNPEVEGRIRIMRFRSLSLRVPPLVFVM